MERKGIINRDLKKFNETRLDNFSADDFSKGDVVYEYTGHTYGVISNRGVAVSREPNETPFLEIPKDAVDWE